MRIGTYIAIIKSNMKELRSLMKFLFLIIILTVSTLVPSYGIENNGKMASLSQDTSVHLTSVRQSVSTTFIGTFIQMTLKGGVFLYLNYLLFLIGLAYSFGKLNFFYFHNRITDKELLNLCNGENKSNEILERINSNFSSMGEVLKIVVENSGKKKPEDLYIILKSCIDFEMEEMKKNFNYIYYACILSVILGILGLVSGLIRNLGIISHTDVFALGNFSKETVNSLIPLEAALISAAVFGIFFFLFDKRIEDFRLTTIKAGKRLIGKIDKLS